MNKIVVIGPGGAGKSYFSKELRDALNLPLYHLDLLFWKEDKTHISSDEFDIKLKEILKKDSWIIDGDYSRTYELRIKEADTIFFLDFPLEKCFEGVEARLHKERDDIPFIDEEFDPEFKEWIINWFKDTRPRVLELLDKYKKDKTLIVFHNRDEVESYLSLLPHKTIDIIGDNYLNKTTIIREACRALIIDNDKVLVSYETKTDQYQLPGGGKEMNETDLECVKREVEEETGYVIIAKRCVLQINEYYEHFKFINKYFIGHIIDKKEIHLTELEKEVGMEPRFIPLIELKEIFSNYEKYRDSNEMRCGMYQREYLALNILSKKI